MKKILKAIGDWIRSKFKLTDFIEQHAEQAIKVVDLLKTIVNSKVFDIAVLYTKNAADDKALVIARQALIEASRMLLIINGNFRQEMTNEQVILRLVEILRGEFPQAQATFYVQLAGMITQALSDGKISLAEAITISQYIYSQKTVK